MLKVYKYIEKGNKILYIINTRIVMTFELFCK